MCCKESTLADCYITRNSEGALHRNAIYEACGWFRRSPSLLWCFFSKRNAMATMKTIWKRRPVFIQVELQLSLSLRTDNDCTTNFLVMRVTKDLWLRNEKAFVCRGKVHHVHSNLRLLRFSPQWLCISSGRCLKVLSLTTGCFTHILCILFLSHTVPDRETIGLSECPRV